VEIEPKDGNVHINWFHEDVTDVNQWVVYFQRGKQWDYQILTADKEAYVLPLVVRSEDGMTPPKVLDTIAVTSVDRLGNESERVYISVR
jgi:hypothetical protein